MGESAGAIPRIIGRYTIFDEIASGGMATVYLGRLLGSGGFVRTVAIKRLHPQFAKDPEFVTMFLDEARLAARIRHPNVVPTLDVVASEGELFLVMEYVQGESLSHLSRALRKRGTRVPIPILVRIMTDALQGLHAAHEARDERGVALNIVHRDVTPQNILVGIDGVSRLLDFGVAKAAGRAQTTQQGQIKGKLAYMAPEQLMNAGVTRETDLYAASVVLWELLTGERLFSGDSEVDIVAKVLKRDIVPPSRLAPEVPVGLDAIVMRGLAADANARFATAREMCMAIGRCGIAEAPSLAVGEWVEALAADSLCERMSKVAAIESQPTTPIASMDETRTTMTPWPYRSSAVEEAFAQIRLLAEAASPEPPREPTSDLRTVTAMPSVARRRARARFWAFTAALFSLLLGGAALAMHSMGSAMWRPRHLDTASMATPRAMGHRGPGAATGAATPDPVEAQTAAPIPAPPASAAPAETPDGVSRSGPTESRRGEGAAQGRSASPRRGTPAPHAHPPIEDDDEERVFRTRE